MVLESYLSGDIINYTYTNENGAFAFENLADGDYKIIADIPGYKSDTSTIYTIGATSMIINSSLCISPDSLYIGTCKVELGIENSYNQSYGFEISAQPNPTSGLFTILSNKYDVSYTVFNSLGVEIATGRLVNNVAKIDISNQPSGIYLIKATSNSFVKEIKIMRE